MNTSANPKKAKTTSKNSKGGRFLKPGDVRIRLGISDETLRALCARGELEHYVIGRQLRFDRKAVAAYLASCRNAKAKAA